MTTIAPSVVVDHRRFRAVFAYGLLAIIALVMVAYRVQSTLVGGHLYQTADWLINYSAGFVRRGLFGEIFLALAPTGQAGLWVLFTVQTLLYAVVFAFGVWFVRRHDFSWSSIALACGPAAIGFFAWDPQASARKEVLAYIALALLVWSVTSVGRRGAVLLPLGALVFFAVGVFSWEATALFLPAIAYLLFRPGEAARFRRWLTVAFAAVGGIGLALAFLSDRSPQAAATICASVRDHGFTAKDLCSGAIDWLQMSMIDGIQGVVGSFPLFTGYLPLALLAALPIVLTPWARRNVLWAILVAGAFVPLMVIAQDEGRWISSIVMALFFCIAVRPVQEATSRAWTWIGAVLYTTLWGIPVWLPAAYAAPWPWLGLVKTLGAVATDLVAFVMR
jgi:hypothetical protein